MSEITVIPELKQIVGALLFAAREPVAVEAIRKALRDAAKQYEGPVKDFEKATDQDIEEAIKTLNDELLRMKAGIHVGEVANGYRLQNDLHCGIWIRMMQEKGRSNRLSKPALETLAIIAYRQPCTRQEIEAVRGVQVDAMIKNLMELQLVKAAGRSELPGRPWLFATTQKFLEYFGLKNVKDLPGVEELRRMEKAQADAKRNEAIEQVEQEEKPSRTVTSQADDRPETGDQSGEEDDESLNGEDLEEEYDDEDGDEYDDEEEYDDEDDEGDDEEDEEDDK
jgi:segregation and condensation protein B